MKIVVDVFRNVVDVTNDLKELWLNIELVTGSHHDQIEFPLHPEATMGDLCELQKLLDKCLNGPKEEE